MVAYTASQLLPYAEDGDRVCDTPALLKELAETVEDRLSSLETSYQGFALRPAAKIKTSPQPALPINDNIHFDLVDFDTANLVDLDIDQQIISLDPIPGPGYEMWLHGAYAVISGAGLNTDQTNVMLTNPNGTYGNDQRDIAAFNFIHAAMLFRLTNLSTAPFLYTYLSPSNAGGSPATFNVSEWEQYGFKVGETQ